MNQQNETTSSLVFQSANNNGIKTTDGRVASPPSNNAKAQNSPKPRKSTSLPAETVEYLKAWMMSPEHISHPYPTEQEKAKIMADTGIELKQLTNWFVNNRKRYWKPRVEARLQQQAQAQNAAAAAAVLASRRVTTTASNGGFEFLSHNGSQVILQPNTGHIIALDIGQAGNAGSQQQPQQILPSPVLTGHQIHLHNAANLVLPSQHNLLPHFQQNNLSNTKDSRTLFPNLHVNESLSHLIINSSLQNPQTRSSSQNDTNSVSHFGANNTSPSIVYDDSTVSSTNNEDSRTSSFSSTTSRQEIQEHEIEPNDKLNAETRMVMRREVVDVHILRPTFTTIGEESSQPTIKDVTILSNVPRDRIIKSYSKCEISYSFPVHIINERKKVSPRKQENKIDFYMKPVFQFSNVYFRLWFSPTVKFKRFNAAETLRLFELRSIS